MSSFHGNKQASCINLGKHSTCIHSNAFHSTFSLPNVEPIKMRKSYKSCEFWTQVLTFHLFSHSLHPLYPIFQPVTHGWKRRICNIQEPGISSITSFVSPIVCSKLNSLSQAYLAYNSSNAVDNTKFVVPKLDKKGHVSIAFWCTKESNSTSILNRTSIFQRSLSPNTCRCDSKRPSTTERVGQRCNFRKKKSTQK